MWQGGRKGRKSAPRAWDKQSVSARELKENSSKLSERTGNVYENKGPLWKTSERSGNVIENKGTYEYSRGMLLKKKELAFLQWCERTVEMLRSAHHDRPAGSRHDAGGPSESALEKAQGQRTAPAQFAWFTPLVVIIM
jgi:hypothetical protein